MSESPQKKSSEVLAEQIESLRKEIIAELKKSSMTLTPEKHDEPKGHKDLDEQLACPTCKGKMLERLRPEIEKELKPLLLKEAKEKLKSKDLVTCDGCGEIVEKTEESCPTCKGKRAH
jgi:rubrerythrin